jgi:hypothetical protein
VYVCVYVCVMTSQPKILAILSRDHHPKKQDEEFFHQGY